MNLSDLAHAVDVIHGFHNINLHLDLIAGLPYEDLTTFKKSFNDVYKMHAEQLQLGFLKVLKGSAIAGNAKNYGIGHKKYPPYEVMYTGWLSYDDVLELKEVEAMVENYYNSGQFTYTLKYLETLYEEPFDIYYELGKYYQSHFKKSVKHARIDRYNILLSFFQEKFRGIERYKDTEELFTELMTYDLYLRENMKTRPAFAKDVTEYRETFKQISRERNLKNMEHLEIFSIPTIEFLTLHNVAIGEIVYFDYKQRDPLTGNAAVITM
jgi:coproporphyrinogen III oxidase-like Fe-S oxidoreductase